MRLLDSLERRFGRYAIRGIIGYIVFFQCIVFAVEKVNPAFVQQLVLKPFEQMDGEWWRLVSFMFVPKTTNLIMFILGAYILLLFMHRIEAGFGAFRMNLFVGLFMVTQWVAAAFPDVLDPQPVLFYANLLFVFAVLEPAMTINLFAIVPVTARVLAFVTAGFVIFNVIRFPELGVSTLLSLIPFLCFGIPLFIGHCRQRVRVGSRRSRFRANSLTVTDSFHRCSVCGRTDSSDPELDFRITDEGIEYCQEHLPGA